MNGPTVELSAKALRSNFLLLQEMAQHVALFPVIKANAYGHGAVQIGALLQDEFSADQAPYFCVARALEAKQLRRSGIKRPILVLSYWEQKDFADFDLMHDIDVCVHTAQDLEKLKQLSGKVGVHLNINTGMNRLGFYWDDIKSQSLALDEVSASGSKLRGVMSHFACADDDAKISFTNTQNERFKKTVNNLKATGHAALKDWKWTHLCNSPALHAALLKEKPYGNAARPGIHLWGVHGSDIKKLKPGFTPVLKVSAPIRQIQKISKGEGLGYGHRFVSTKNSIIATVAMGYADGIPRQLSRAADDKWRIGFVVEGERVPIAGTVSMDLTMIDLTEHPKASHYAKTRDPNLRAEWICFGQPVEEIAAHLKTISYEILCGLNHRIERRVYVGSP
jgi:alanine racemase